MSSVSVLEAVAGGALVFFLPGFTVAKALFPERRVRGPNGIRWATELVTLGLVLSVVLTVVVGYLLLSAGPGGFSASWSDPLLEVSLAAIALVAFVVGWFEGSYRAVPPTASRPTGDDPGLTDPWELGQRLDLLQRQRIALERRIARAGAADTGPDRAQLASVVAEESALRRAREADYDL